MNMFAGLTGNARILHEVSLLSEQKRILAEYVIQVCKKHQVSFTLRNEIVCPDYIIDEPDYWPKIKACIAELRASGIGVTIGET